MQSAGADPGGGGGGGGHGGSMPPPFGTEQARNAEVYRTLIAHVATPTQRTSESLLHVLHTQSAQICSSKVEETVLWQCLKHKG